MLNRKDSICIEKNDGYSVIGFFIKEDEENVMIEATVGDNMGNNVIVPKRNISQIVVIRPRNKSLGRSLTEQERKDW
jgi:hypothetical protein